MELDNHFIPRIELNKVINSNQKFGPTDDTILQLNFHTMGASGSKAAKSGARKFPTRPPGSAIPPSSAQRAARQAPIVEQQYSPQASYAKDDGTTLIFTRVITSWPVAHC